MDIARVLTSIRPSAQWALRGNEYTGLDWIDQTQVKPTEAELIAGWDALLLREAKDAKINAIDAKTASDIEALAGDNNKQKDKLAEASMLLRRELAGIATAPQIERLNDLEAMNMLIIQMKANGNDKEAMVEACKTLAEVEAIVV